VTGTGVRTARKYAGLANCCRRCRRNEKRSVTSRTLCSGARPVPHCGKSGSRLNPAAPTASRGSVNGRHRGMHLRCLFKPHGSRGPNSRRGIASPDFRLRSAAPCSNGRPPRHRVPDVIAQDHASSGQETCWLANLRAARQRQSEKRRAKG
jgi:hypothetical protein